MKYEEQLIYYFEAGRNYSQTFFEAIIQSALEHKYKIFKKGFIFLLSGRDITDAIFNLTDKDFLEIFNKTVNGKKLKELFISSIYLRYLDFRHEGKIISITIPFTEESYDVAFYVSEKENLKMKSKDKLELSGCLEGYPIQIKEEFDYKASKDGYKVLKKGLDMASMDQKCTYYDELVLIFIRDYIEYTTAEIKTFLDDNKNVALISTPSFIAKENLSADKGAERQPSIQKGKYNFLIHTWANILHVKFNPPNFLQPSSRAAL